MHKTDVQLSRRRTAPADSIDQQRFRFLLQELEKTRHAREALEATILKFRQDRTLKLQPLRASLAAACRETVLAIDRLLELRSWTRAERQSLTQMLCSTAEAVLEASSQDAEIKAVYDRHADVGFDAGRRKDFERLKAHAEEMTGVDLGDDPILDEDDPFQRISERMREKEAADEAAREARPKRKKPSQAEQRKEELERLAKQSLRDIYRKLASALHPDREPDPKRREQKNELMQRINRAYAANDLLTLFETQMQIEAIDAAAISAGSGERLKQYNKLLSEQLTAMKAGIRDLESSFCTEYHLRGGALTARRLTQAIREQVRWLRDELDQQKQFLAILAERAAVKRWLKHQRALMTEPEDDDDF